MLNPTGSINTKSIALVFAGGTIDSDKSERGRSVAEHYSIERYKDLLEELRELCKSSTIHLVEPPFRIDSSQLQLKHFSDLLEFVRKCLQSYDSIIISFGTDTLAYVMPYIALSLDRSDANKCVIFVTGMTAWNERLDGYRNLRDAVTIANAGTYRGVIAVSNGRVLRPFNLRKISHEAEDPFREIQLQPFQPNEKLPNLSKVIEARLKCGEEINTTGGQKYIGIPIEISEAYLEQPIRPVVAQQLIYPGLTREILAGLADYGIKHVILWCYANGTACLEGGLRSIYEAIVELRQKRVAVYAVSQQIGVVNPHDYKVCQALVDAGCLYVTRFTGETLYSVLLFLDTLYYDTEKVRKIIEDIEKAAQENRSNAERSSSNC